MIQNTGYYTRAIAVDVAGYAIIFSSKREKIEQNDKAIELTFQVLMKLLFCKHKNFRSLRWCRLNENNDNKKSLRVKVTSYDVCCPHEKLIFSLYYFVASSPI